MNKEYASIEELKGEQEGIRGLLSGREATYNAIGAGKIRVGDSLESTLKVGRAKKAVRSSIVRFQKELEEMEGEVDLFERRQALGQISEMVAEGHLPQDVLQKHQREYEALAARPQKDPVLHRGLERVRQKEEKIEKPEELAEYGPLSKVDVAVIAGAISGHRPILNAVLKQTGGGAIDDSVVRQAAELVDSISPRFKDLNPQERESLLGDKRKIALEKAQEMMRSSDFGSVLEEISTKDESVGLLFLQLSILHDVQGRIGNSQDKSSGVDFLRALLRDKKAGEAGFTLLSDSGESDAVVYERTTEGKVREKKVVIEPLSSSPLHQISEEEPETVPVVAFKSRYLQSIPFEVFSATEVEPIVIMDEPQVEDEDQVHEVVDSGREKQSKPRGIEGRDPAIRELMHEYFDQISEKDELYLPASPGVVTRSFQRLKQSVVDPLIEKKLVPTVPGSKGDHYALDAAGIATALYLSNPDHRNRLSKSLQKQVQNLAAEELAKRQEEQKK